MSALHEVLSRYALSSAVPKPLGNHGGFSGARLWRIDAGAAPFCLRVWPPGDPTPQRLRWLHELMAAARTAELTFVPHLVPVVGSTFIEHAGLLWELTEWLPGRADSHQHPSPSRLRAACVALARLHDAWAHLRSVRGHCPALARRLDRTKTWLTLVASGWRPAFPPGDPIRPWAEQAVRLLSLWAERVPSLLAAWADLTFVLHTCLSDVWHDHILFEGEVVSGIVDYGSCRIDHPAADLARLLGSLIGDDASAWSTGLDAYAALRPLSPEDQALARALDRSGVILGTVNWLTWLYHDGRHFENRQVVADRLASLVHRLEGFSDKL
jgi:Ser/Thr protein kinase RdoA (MazF antagonist)